MKSVVSFPSSHCLTEKGKPSKAVLAATTHLLEDLDITTDNSDSSDLQQRIVNEVALIKKLAQQYASCPMVLIPSLPSPSMSSAALLAITPTFNETIYVSNAPPRRYLKLNPEVSAEPVPISNTIPCAPFVPGVMGVSQTKVQFVAIYRGIDGAANVFLCLSKDDLDAFNAIAESLGTSQSRLTRAWAACGEQVFASTLHIRKQHNGWKHGNALFPFNAVCVFEFDFARNAVVAMKAMETDGFVESVGQCGSVWIRSAIKVNAEEQRGAREPKELQMKCGKVATVNFVQRELRDAWADSGAYLMHDYDHTNDGLLAAGMRIKICLKLSTKTNRKHKMKRRRPIWVQAWNVRQA